MLTSLTSLTSPTSPTSPTSAPETTSPSPVTATPAAPTRGRDRYIDTLRVLALGRVIAFHVTGWVALPLIFPSMGVIFALAGSLMAASLDRSPQNTWRVLHKRLRRMLPPLWALGLVLVPLMLVLGWTADEQAGAGSEFGWTSIALWLLPLADPPSSAAGAGWVIPLWYIRAYLWFVLASPIMLWCFRRWPVRTLLTPLVVMLGYGVGLVELNGAEGDVVLEWAVFGACWVLGFAHHDNLIRSIPLRKVVPAGLALMAAGVGWALLYPNPEVGFNLPDIPVADGLYCLGFVLLLLRIYPDFSWIARYRWLDALIAAMNRRAMTIYLWGNVAIFSAIALIARVPALEPIMVDGSLTALALTLTVTWALIGVAVLTFGWVEDVAANRPVQLLPTSPGRHARPRTVRPALLATAATPSSYVPAPAEQRCGELQVQGART